MLNTVHICMCTLTAVSTLFGKNFVKVTFLLRKSWFDEIFCQPSVNFSYFHTILNHSSSVEKREISSHWKNFVKSPIINFFVKPLLSRIFCEKRISAIYTHTVWIKFFNKNSVKSTADKQNYHFNWFHEKSFRIE